LKGKNLNKRSKTLRTERLLGIAAVVSIVIAWIVGANLAGADLQPHLEAALPQADRFEPLSGDMYAAWQGNDNEELIGYVAIGSANGYGGPMTLAVAVDPEGQVVGMSIVDQKETPSYLKRVIEAGIPDELLGKSYQENFVLGNDVDAVSSATYTTQAMTESVRDASRSVADKQLGFEVPSVEKPKIVFGIPEFTLIALYAVGFFGHQKKFKYKKQIRWASMLTGLVVLGFIFNRPFTLSHVNQLLLGYWPQWQTNLYWYFLLGGILFVFTVDNKNPYCDWFCPFGAAQECMGAIGGAKTRSVGRFRDPLKWMTRIVVWAAIVIALLLRNPGVTSYEVFGTLFSLTGSMVQFALLGIVLVTALFIRRPWCTYLCPLKPVTDLYRIFRGWVTELWQNLKPKSAA
jgi:uncharacterized protein with FMN-binding domain